MSEEDTLFDEPEAAPKGIRARYPEVIAVCADWRSTNELAEMFQVTFHSITQAMLRWEEAGAVQVDPRPGKNGFGRMNYYRATAIAMQPHVILAACGPRAGPQMLHRLGIETVHGPPPPVPPTPPARLVPQSPFRPRPPEPPALPTNLFDATFTPDGVLISYDQFHRLIELLHLTTNNGSTNG